MAETCRSQGQYGRCGLILKHGGDHAVPIGDGVWFVYHPGGGGPVGYCQAITDGWGKL